MSLLEARDLSKRYGAVVALRSATLVVEPGEIHALLGANGAGKSTLVKMLTGVTRPDSGTIVVQGAPVRIASPLRAQRHGLAVVFQDPALAPDMTVRQNLRLTGTNIREVRRWLGEMDFNVDLSASVQDVPLPALRLLDLARALSRDPRLLMLDEITAALPSDLAERVFAIMKQWREQGRSVLFITHRLAEVTALCDRATILRDGADVGVMVPSEGGEAQIVEMMLGPEAAAAARAATETGHDEAVAIERERIEVTGLRDDEIPALEVRGLQRRRRAPRRVAERPPRRDRGRGRARGSGPGRAVRGDRGAAQGSVGRDPGRGPPAARAHALRRHPPGGRARPG